MTDEERFSLLVSVMGANDVIARPRRAHPRGRADERGLRPRRRRASACRALLMSDASLGRHQPRLPARRHGAPRCRPAIALGASFNPALARAAGAMIGREARSRGFNVMLAGGINLARDPRNGRNFEYCSEDPLLSAVLAAEAIAGIQGEGVISTIKHYSLNCNETNRHWLDAIIDPAAHRESDLLAFEIAIERAQPGSVMSGYNKVNGDYAGGNRLPAQGRAQGRLGLPGLGDVRLGRDARVGVRARGARPGVRRPDRRDDVGAPSRSPAAARQAYARGRAARRSASRRWCGASCARCTRSASTRGGRAPEVRHWRRTTRSRSRRARQGIVLLEERRRPAARHRHDRADRGDRRLRPARRADAAPARARSLPAGGYAARDPDRRPRDHGRHAQPLPAAVVAARGAARGSCRRRRSSSTPA